MHNLWKIRFALMQSWLYVNLRSDIIIVKFTFENWMSMYFMVVRSLHHCFYIMKSLVAFEKKCVWENIIQL